MQSPCNASRRRGIVARPSGRWSRPTPLSIAIGVCVAALVLEYAPAAFGQVPSVLSDGPPLQVNPYVSEPGVPAFSVTPGTANPFTGADGSDGDDSGGSSGDGGSGSSTAGASDALSTMLGTLWGSIAVANAQSVGVNPSALAGMCVVESTTCDSSAQNGSFTGAFQMGSAAFQDGLKTALAANPALASQIVQGPGGINDPTTEAIAASGYLLQANQALQNAGVSNPTTLDARGYYNFGPTAGVQIAGASPSDLMSQYISPAAMQGNGISSTETVAQWQASVTAKMGNAASQTISS